MSVLAPIDLEGPTPVGRPQAYAPVLPGDMSLTTSPRQQAARIEEWLESAAVLAGVTLDPPPRYRATFERAAAAAREPLGVIAADVAARFVAGEAAGELLADAARREAQTDYKARLVLDALDGYDFRAATDRLDTVAAKLTRPFKAAVKALTAAAADLPDPWESKPSVIASLVGMDVPTWDESGPLGQAAKADRVLAPSVWKVEDALSQLAACAVTRADHWLSEVLAFDDEAETLGDDRLRLSIFEAHGVADLALVAVAQGTLPSITFSLRR